MPNIRTANNRARAANNKKILAAKVYRRMKYIARYIPAIDPILTTEARNYASKESWDRVTEICRQIIV